MITFTAHARPLPPIELYGLADEIATQAEEYMVQATKLGLGIMWTCKDREAVDAVHRQRGSKKDILHLLRPRFRAARNLRQYLREAVHVTKAEMFPCRPVTRCVTEEELAAKFKQERGWV